PPTRNPLLARKPAPVAESARETGEEEPREEPSVEVADSLLEDEVSDPNSTAIKPNPLAAGRKPAAPPARPPVRPPLPRK
ncbi:MAG: hypothetical protein ACOZQL_34190, partial [Myxococcota bacterium]